MAPRKGQANLTDDARRRIAARRLEGEPATVVARDFGVSARTVARIAAAANWAGRPPGRPPVSADVTHRIAERVLRNGERCGDVAASEGLDRSTVWRIARKLRRAAPNP